MLSARYLASISDDIVKLYAQLEYDIKTNMAKRIARLGKIDDKVLWQAQILKETGGLKSDIDRYITSYNAKAQELIKTVFNEAMDKAKADDLKYFAQGKRDLDPSQLQNIETSIKRFNNAEQINKTYAARSKKFSSDETYQSIQRMTLTVADSCQKQFLQQCNEAYMKVNSGAFSQQKALIDAVDELASEGVKTVYYTGSGRTREYTIEAAVRMNILTGINQTASQQTLQNCEELETDLVEVSAHIGARPEHEAWQGKIYSISGTSSKYPPFSICRLGEADGLCGINCRHSYYPYFEGMAPRYSDGELDEMKEAKVTLDGKEMTRYEAEQRLRFCERQIRAFKTKIDCFEYAGMSSADIPEYTRAKEKLTEWQKTAAHICDETKIFRDYSREYIGTARGKQPKGSK